MLENYFPILLFILVGLAVGLGPLILGKLVSPHKPDSEKNTKLLIILTTTHCYERKKTPITGFLVPTERLELSRPKSQPPQGCVSTNSTTTATILTSPNLVRNIFRGIANWRRHSNRYIAWCRFCRFSFNWFIVNFNFLCLSSSFYHTTIACTVACHIS